MKIIGLVVAIMMLPGIATAQITPEQDAQVKRVLREVLEIDEELKAIQSNQQTLETNKAARRDEYRSLMARYPGIKLAPESTTTEMYGALYRYRMTRAATIKPLVEEQLRASRIKTCTALRELEAGRAKIEATDEYKQAKLQDRIELRKALDDVIAEAKSEGDPCSVKDE